MDIPPISTHFQSFDSQNPNSQINNYVNNTFWPYVQQQETLYIQGSTDFDPKMFNTTLGDMLNNIKDLIEKNYPAMKTDSGFQSSLWPDVQSDAAQIESLVSSPGGEEQIESEVNTLAGDLNLALQYATGQSY
jgi:hypothetical protein